MYTIEWASNFAGFTKAEPMNLQKFVFFYEEHIAGRTFYYKTENKELPTFIIDSRTEQLPHLLALHKWNNVHIKQAPKQYELLKTGDWDIPFLEKADQGTFKEHQSRIESMPYLYSMLYECDCEIRQIHPVMNSPFKNRKIDMIFQKPSSKLAHILELREKDTTGDNKIYIPTSFSVYPKKSNALKGKHTNLKVSLINIENH
jgi:hypothetical protein